MAFDLVLRNASLLPMTQAQSATQALRAQAIAIAGGRIAFAGGENDLPNSEIKSTTRVVDVKGRCVTPGLIDCHTHLIFGGNRAHEFSLRLAGKTYLEIAAAGGGIKSSVKATRAASEADLREGAGVRVEKLRSEGVTTIEIKSGYGLDCDTEMKMLRVARSLPQHHPVDVVTTFLGAHSVPNEYSGNADGYIDFLCSDVLPEVAARGLADAVDGWVDPGGFTVAQIRRLFTVAKQHGLRVKLHTGQFGAIGGPALAAEFNALSCEHLEHVTEDDCRVMGQAGVVATLLPGAFYYLRETHKPRIDLLRKYNVPIAISTDSNPGSSPLQSLLLAMNMGCVLFDMTAEEALLGATRVAARALDLQARKGQLAVGYDADIAIWDCDEGVEIVYAIAANPCAAVVKAGKPVLDRSHLFN